MKAPRKLKLNEAISVTKNPLVRWGDLLHVASFEVNNGERWRSTLLPNLPDSTGKFDPVFKQPDTEQWLRQHYKDGGRIESIAHFSDVELALYFNYRGGKCNTNPWMAGSVGDASVFVTDCNAALALTVNQTQDSLNTIKSTILYQHQKYLIPAINGKPFVDRQKKPGEGRGKIRTSIKECLNKNPNMKNKDIWDAIAKSPPPDWTGCDNQLGKYFESPPHNMNYERFCNVCSEERKALKPKFTG